MSESNVLTTELNHELNPTPMLTYSTPPEAAPETHSDLHDVLILKGCNTSNEKVCFLSWSNGDCGIMHMPVLEVELAGVPSTWELPSGHSNCIQLECEHCFHASALMVHFLTHNMTCPVCRDGFDSKMDPASLPREIRDVFVKHCASVEQRARVEENLMVHVNMNFENIMRDWNLLAHVNDVVETTANTTWTTDVSIVSSRLRLPSREQVSACLDALEPLRSNANTEAIDTIQRDTSLIPVFVQNSFVRHMNILNQRRDGNYGYGSMQAQFHLHHPMLSFTFSSTVPATMESLLSDTECTVFKPLVHDGLFVGYITNRNAQPNSALLCHTEPVQCLMLWLRIDLMTQCVVGQIQDHLQQQLPNEFAVTSQNTNFFSRDSIPFSTPR